MRIEEIEKALKNLPAPEPPADLKARCLATIPAEASGARTLTWKERLKMPAVRTALAMATALTIALMISVSRPGAPNGAAVFAATIEAMRGVSFFHVKDRQMSIYPDGSGREGAEWYSGRWVNSETWFDMEYGIFTDAYAEGETQAHHMSLELPDGRHFERDVVPEDRSRDRLRIVVFGPERWERIGARTARRITDVSRLVRGINWEVEPRLVSTEQGEWQGRRATVLTFITPPTPEKAARGCPTVRGVGYVDPETKLTMALRIYSQGGGQEGLVREAVFDYSPRPDPSIFDPRRVEKGAGSIERVKGRPGVRLSP